MRHLFLLPFLTLSIGAAQEDEAARRLRAANRNAADLMRVELERPGGRPHDVRSRAALLGFDPAKIRAFLLGEIRTEPYEGVQRGPAGVLASLGGNPADKSYLAMEMLRAGGLQARIVRGRLPRNQAEALVQEWLKGDATAKWRVGRGAFGEPRPDRARLEKVWTEIGLSGADFWELISQGTRAREALWQEALELTDREHGHLWSGRTLPEVVSPDLAQSFETHYWVRWRRTEEEEWKDLDPCLPEPAGVEGEEVSDPSALASKFTLTLQLEGERAGKRETVALFCYEVPIYETLERPLRFSIQPTKMDQMPMPGETKSPEEVYHKLSSFREFQAVLMVGQEVFASKVFDYDGKISDVQGDGQIKMVHDFGSTLGEKFGGLNFGEGEKKKEKGRLVSLWVDLEARSPGRLHWKQRRGLLEEDRRETWCPILSWNLFFQTHFFSREFVRSARMSTQVTKRALVEKLDDWVSSQGKGDLRAILREKVEFFPHDLLDFCLARQAALADLPGIPWFRSPNLFVSGSWGKLHPKEKSVCLCYGIDVVDNGIAVLDARGKTEVRATSRLGVFDTVLESLLVRQANEDEPGLSTLSGFERARIQNRPWRFLPSRPVEDLEKAGVPRREARWIARNSGEGTVVVVTPPEGDRPFAWWSIDPATGQTIGRISGGRGGSEVQTKAEITALYTVWEYVSLALCGAKVIKYTIKRDWKGVGKTVLICAAAGVTSHHLVHHGGYAGLLAAHWIEIAESIYSTVSLASH